MSSSPQPSSNISNSLSKIDVLEHVLRPTEIESCTWMNVDVMGNRLLPHTCACYNIPDQNACANGFMNVRLGNEHQVFETNPNSLITWCVNNVPQDYTNNRESLNSWVVGCFNGIRGPHKIV
jgi:hypothetical protein